MNYNKDEMEPPIWMDEKFFNDVLNVCKKGKFLKIIKYEITPATVVGDHFASIMFRAKVTYLDNVNSENVISLIVKTLPDDGIKQELLKDGKLFETEILMYRDIIPKFEEILRKAGDNTVLGAKMLYCTLSPRKIIIFEDITKTGYKTVGTRLANLEETQLALEKLAKWHAVSYFYNEQSNGALETLVDGIFAIPNLQTNDFFSGGISELLKLIKDLPEFENYVPKLEKINKKLLQKCANTYIASKTSAVQVLNHGDFHSKNMMFKYDENGKVEDVMLIDFQISVWGTMAIDLLYATYILTDMNTRLKYMDEIRYNFFNIFLDTLKKIGYVGKLPVYTDLQIDFIKFGYMELFFVATFIPYLLAMQNLKQGDIIDPSEIIENSNERSKLYNQEAYIEELRVSLPIFLYKGFLDGYDD